MKPLYYQIINYHLKDNDPKQFQLTLKATFIMYLHAKFNTTDLADELFFHYDLPLFYSLVYNNYLIPLHVNIKNDINRHPEYKNLLKVLQSYSFY